MLDGQQEPGADHMHTAHVTEDSRKFTTLPEVAKWAGRSYAWARDRAVDGRFEARRLPNGRILVTVDSVAREMRGQLRVVADNTKKKSGGPPP